MHKFLDNIVKGLSSIKTASILLSLIILVSAIGTFIPQGLPPDEYDIYHSWWFISILFLFGFSLLICTLKRLALWRKKIGACLTHLGLLLVLIGALITAIFGEKGFLIVYEGHWQDTFVKADRQFKELDFKIYLDDFSIKNFKSKITILEKGQPARAQTIEVNRPLKYKGYAFYQASYDRDKLKWSGLDVVKDPGVPFVFGGFILLNMGVMLAFLGGINATATKTL